MPEKENPHRINEQITVPEVRVVGDNVPQAQVMPIRDALRLADELELDLIEISPKAEPPVCRIADYQKFLYQQKKKAKELKANQTKVVVKEIRFGPQTDDHDYNFKLKHAQNFLKEGAKVKAYVFFRGRSIVFKEQGEILLLRFATDLEELAKVESMPRLDGKKMSAKDIILALNKVGGENGIGLLDIVENRLVGIKCRGVYETPGGTVLYAAHDYLETVCLDKYTAHEKQKLAITFAELVYNGQWYTPLREALSAFVDKTQERVTGKVRLKLYKGNIIKAGVWSDWSLYNEEIATFGEDHVYDQADATGFINLFGLPIKVQAQVDAAAAKKQK